MDFETIGNVCTYQLIFDLNKSPTKTRIPLSLNANNANINSSK